MLFQMAFMYKNEGDVQHFGKLKKILDLGVIKKLKME